MKLVEDSGYAIPRGEESFERSLRNAKDYLEQIGYVFEHKEFPRSCFRLRRVTDRATSRNLHLSDAEATLAIQTNGISRLLDQNGTAGRHIRLISDYKRYMGTFVRFRYGPDLIVEGTVVDWENSLLAVESSKGCCRKYRTEAITDIAVEDSPFISATKSKLLDNDLRQCPIIESESSHLAYSPNGSSVGRPSTATLISKSLQLYGMIYASEASSHLAITEREACKKLTITEPHFEILSKLLHDNLQVNIYSDAIDKPLRISTTLTRGIPLALDPPSGLELRIKISLLDSLTNDWPNSIFKMESNQALNSLKKHLDEFLPRARFSVPTTKFGNNLLCMYLDGYPMNVTIQSNDLNCSGDLIVNHLFNTGMEWRFRGTVDGSPVPDSGLSVSSIKAIRE